MRACQITSDESLRPSPLGPCPVLRVSLGSCGTSITSSTSCPKTRCATLPARVRRQKLSSDMPLFRPPCPCRDKAGFVDWSAVNADELELPPGEDFGIETCVHGASTPPLGLVSPTLRRPGGSRTPACVSHSRQDTPSLRDSAWTSAIAPCVPLCL